MNAIKPVYNRKTKCYTVEVVQNADPILCYDGYAVYDNEAYALGAIDAGRFLQGWPGISQAGRGRRLRH